MAKKNLAASKLSKLAHSSMTPAERTERARKAGAARWGKTNAPKPGRWYGLFAYDPNATEGALVKYSQNKIELRELLRERDRAEPGRDWTIESLDYDPRTRIPIVPKYEPDTTAQLRALQDLQRLDAGEERGRS